MTADLTVLSLGAGVQSTTVALLAVEGVLPKPDAAIFADTGWEPQSVYAHLARLTPALEAAGIEVLRVNRGNLRRDALDPAARFVAIPYHTLAPEGTTPVLVGCSLCNGESTGHDDHEGTLCCPVCDCTGQMPDPSGRKRPLTRREREGMGRRQCTSEYKLAPIRREVRRLLGAAPPDYKRVPKGKVAEQWVGFSTDEVHRANRRKDNGGVSYLTTRYPLLDLEWSRADCRRWLAARGWQTAKSACIGCPFHGNREWRELREGDPAEWADAVEFDRAIRKGGARARYNGEAFLHRSRVPLELAPIDRVTSAEWHSRQTDLFEQIADAEAGYDPDEDGTPFACSPFGCGE